MTVTRAKTAEKAMKTRHFAYSYYFSPPGWRNAVLRFFAAITVIFICTPFVLGPIAIIASIPDIGTKIFVGLCLSIPYLGVARAITAFSIDSEVGRKVRRQRQMHRVQGMIQQVEEVERLTGNLSRRGRLSQ